MKAPATRYFCWTIFTFLIVCAATPAMSQVPRNPLYILRPVPSGRTVGGTDSPPQGFRRMEREGGRLPHGSVAFPCSRPAPSLASTTAH